MKPRLPSSGKGPGEANENAAALVMVLPTSAKENPALSAAMSKKSAVGSVSVAVLFGLSSTSSMPVLSPAVSTFLGAEKLAPPLVEVQITVSSGT